MNACIVSQYFWPENFRINDVVEALVKRGHRLTVLTGQPNYPHGVIQRGYRSPRPKRSLALGCEVLRVPLVARGKGSGFRLALNYASFASTATVFGSLGMRGPVDIVLAYEPSPVTVAIPALAVARRMRAPALMWVQDLWPQTLRSTARLPNGSIGWLATTVSEKLHRSMNGLLVQSEAFIEPLVDQGVARERIVYLPNWAEEEFRPVDVPQAAPERLELPEGFVVMFAGNLGVAQGLEVLLDAAERLREIPAIQWVILGDGRQADWLRSEKQRRKLDNVHMLGQRPQASMPTWFALADALLVTLRPGGVYELTIPSKVQAYLACGRPILASLDGEGARAVRESGAGFAAAAGDGAGLAAATRKMYEMSADARAELGRRGRDYSRQNFDRHILLDRLESVLHRYAGERTLPVESRP